MNKDPNKKSVGILVLFAFVLFSHISFSQAYSKNSIKLGWGIGGVALGGTLCGGIPVCMITGGVAGFTGGAIAASYINNWVNGW